MFICLETFEAGSVRLIVVNANYIRSVHQACAKTLNEQMQQHGIQSYLLMQYGDIETTVVYTTAHIQTLADMLDAKGRPQ